MFVDGLDELEGDYEALARFLHNICSTSTNLKIIASSRPLVDFHEQFNACSQLQVQDLTQHDIEMYIDDELASNDNLFTLRSQRPDETQQLTATLASQASGVFFWVRLVVRSLLDAFKNRDSVEDLIRRTLILPTELERLYRHMLSQLSPMYYQRALCVFGLMLANARFSEKKMAPDLGILIMAVSLRLVVKDDSDSPLRSNHALKQHDWYADCSDLETNLKAWCVGLVDVVGERGSHMHELDSLECLRIQFLRRSLAESLQQSEPWMAEIDRAFAMVNGAAVQLRNAYIHAVFLKQQHAEIVLLHGFNYFDRALH